MTVPKYYEFFPSFLEAIKDGNEHTFKSVIKFCADAFKLSDEDRNDRMESGRTILYIRVCWAKTYLSKAGLVRTPKRGTVQLTVEGKKVVKNKAIKVDLKYLKNYKSFNEFFKYKNKNSSGEDVDTSNIPSSLSPEERISSAFDVINQALASELMDEIRQMDPYKFEKLVVKLLLAMGYGSPIDNQFAVTKKSSDEGIDGIIKQDKLGFDSIYVQAKKWKKTKPVGRPQVQAFAGAMMGAKKGLFITTGKFAKTAIEFAEKNPTSKIVLVDGDKLAQLMIEFDVGVSILDVYKVKKLDSDFFEDFE